MTGVRGAACLAAVLLVGCVSKTVREPERPPLVNAPSRPRPDTVRPAAPDIPLDDAPLARTDGPRDVRIALATAAQGAWLDATKAWRLFDERNAVLVRGQAGDPWNVERRGRQLRATSPKGGATPWSDGPLTLRSDGDDALVLFAQRRYRGALRFVSTDSTLMVVNVLPVEAYLRGVVPMEIGGPRAANEQAAVEAQAIAARSYTYIRLIAAQDGASRNANYDLLPTVSDQVYGGADAERPFSDQAVRATAGLVITYAGRIVNAPYHSACGGETAAPDEVWRSTNEPYLRRVSDRIPGTTDRYYCDPAPRFAWTRTFTADELDAALRAHLKAYVAVPAGGPGRVRSVNVELRTPSGRVARLSIITERGTFTLRGNDIRYVMRLPGGEILNSTYFMTESESRAGSLSRLVIKGNGYGHGIGMCQWGAIGRARAGQSARSILATYYPGTSIGTVN